MYRAVALYALREDFIVSKELDRKKLIDHLPKIELEFKYNSKTQRSDIYLNDEDVENFIRNMEVSKWVSQVAAISEVRRKLVKQQQKMGVDKGIVMDGRDIGSVVFPDAELKIFMTASAEVRAKRRYKELADKNENTSYDEVLKNVKERDKIDSSRKDSPLIKTKDAVEIDNSKMSKKEQLQLILKLAKEKIK